MGRSAALAALQRGADVSVFDIDRKWSYYLAKEIRKSLKRRIGVETDLGVALGHYDLLVEATNAADVIDADFIRPYTHIAAPGMPLGLTPAAVEKISGRLLHDPLQIGTAVMAIDAVISRSVEEWRIMLPYGTYFAQPLPGAAKNPGDQGKKGKKDSAQKHKSEDEEQGKK